MRFSAVRAGVNLGLFFGLVSVLLGPYVMLLAIAPRKRHRVAQLFFKGCLALTGLRLNVQGKPVEGVALYAANHASYLDIPVLGAAINGGVFVAKSEVADWPLFGFLARISHTVFISRNSADAARQRTQLATRINRGSSLILFPEGTSTDGSHVKRFKSALFAALNDVERDVVLVQPVSIAYARHRNGASMEQKTRESFTWFGDLTLAPHLINVFGIKGCEVDIVFHNALNPAHFTDRKQLAKACERTISKQLIKSLDQIETLPVEDGSIDVLTEPSPVIGTQ